MPHAWGMQNKQITLNVPIELREKLEKIAAEQQRSLGGQIRFILDQAVSATDTEAKAESQEQ